MVTPADKPFTTIEDLYYYWAARERWLVEDDPDGLIPDYLQPPVLTSPLHAGDILTDLTSAEYMGPLEIAPGTISKALIRASWSCPGAPVHYLACWVRCACDYVTATGAASILHVASAAHARRTLDRWGIRPVAREAGRAGESVYRRDVVETAQASRSGSGTRTDLHTPHSQPPPTTSQGEHGSLALPVPNIRVTSRWRPTSAVRSSDTTAVAYTDGTTTIELDYSPEASWIIDTAYIDHEPAHPVTAVAALESTE